MEFPKETDDKAGRDWHFPQEGKVFPLPVKKSKRMKIELQPRVWQLSSRDSSLTPEAKDLSHVVCCRVDVSLPRFLQDVENILKSFHIQTLLAENCRMIYRFVFVAINSLQLKAISS